MTRWTTNDNHIVSVCFMAGMTAKYVQKILPHLSLNSIRMKYANCRFLRGDAISTLSNVSKEHWRVWQEIAHQ